MNRISEIDKHIDKLRPKIAIGGRDWTKTEKESIEEAYFQITKVSTVRKKGRTVDLGCPECVASAVNIIKNYMALIEGREEASADAGADDWKATTESIEALAEQLGFEFPKSAKKKAQKLAALEAHIAENSGAEEEGEEDDLLGEPTKEQLIEIIKAKTGEEVDPDDYTLEELQAFADEDEEQD